MDYVQFKISDVKYGWIFAALETEAKQVNIANSYLGGLQMPGVLLKGIIELLSEKECEKWICWHGESNSYIWHLKVKDEWLELWIYEGGSSFGLPSEGEALGKTAEVSQVILETNTLLYSFASSVCDALKFYGYGKGYDIWQRSKYRDSFPRAELSQLRKLLRRQE